MARLKLEAELERRLAPDVYKNSSVVAGRLLWLQDLSDDLQFGLLTNRTEKHGKTFHMVDIGVRIPSVESVYDAYEEDQMKDMGFPDPSPLGWLTFWTDIASPTGYKGSCDDPALILTEFHRLRDEVREDLDAASDHYRQHLSRCSLPAWATMPGSSFLVIRTLACCPDKRTNLEALLQSRSDLGFYERDVYKFMEWFAQHID